MDDGLVDHISQLAVLILQCAVYAPRVSCAVALRRLQYYDAMSKTVVNSICNQTGSKNRGVIITDVMSGINWCQVPVTIVEMGFMSNPDEDRLLGDSTYQDKIVTGIVLGINEYFKN